MNDKIKMPFDDIINQTKKGQNKNKNLNIQLDNNISVLNIKQKYTLLQKEIFDLFVKNSEVVEVRIPKVRGKSLAWGSRFANGTVSGYFDNFDNFKKAVDKAVQYQQSNIYFTLQVIDPRLIGRACNKLNPTDLTTSDSNVLYYRWIPIDIDPHRPAGVSSSDSELERAIDLRDMVRDWILDNTKYQSLITAISGNGAHILIRLPEDLKVDNDSKNLIKSFLQKVHEIFSTNDIAIDTAVFNPGRIWKLYGTKAMKGDEVPENKYREALIHRESYIDDLEGVYEL